MAIGIQSPRLHDASFFKAVLKIPFHQTQPIGIGLNFVVSIHTGNGVFAIHNRRNRAFNLNIGQQRLISASYRMRAVKDQCHMKTVVAQQYRIWRLRAASVTGKFFWLGQRTIIDQQLTVLNMISPRICVACAINWKGAIQKDTRPRDDPCPVTFVVFPFRGLVSHGIGAIKAVIKASPTGIGRIQSVTSICYRHHQLWTGDRCNFRINIACLNLKGVTLFDKIPDVFEKCFISFVVMGCISMSHMPSVNFVLNFAALFNQRAIYWCKVFDHVGQPFPEYI